MAKNPEVSVCIPVFNGEKYISKAISSVLEQTFTDFELIIIDNASSDSTLAVVESFQDERLRIVSNEVNIGMGANFNRCLEVATGKYIQILCHDDYLDKRCVEKKVAAFKAAQNIALVFSASNIVDDQNRVITKRQPYGTDLVFDGKKLAHKSFTKKNIFGEPSNVMINRKYSKKAGFFDDKLYYCIDWEYWIRVSLFGNVYYLEDTLMYFRVSDSSTSYIWMKTQKRLKDDDKLFISKCMKNKRLGLKKTNVYQHRFNINLRTFARKVVFRLYSNETIKRFGKPRKKRIIPKNLYFPNWLQQFFKFGLVGISNTIVGLACYYLVLFLGANYIVANTGGFIAGVINSYIWNKKFVFKYHKGSIWNALKVLLIYGFSLMLSTALLYLLIDLLGISRYIAPMLNLVITTPVNFLLNKHWAFREKKITD